MNFYLKSVLKSIEYNLVKKIWKLHQNIFSLRKELGGKLLEFAYKNLPLFQCVNSDKDT